MYGHMLKSTSVSTYRSLIPRCQADKGIVADLYVLLFNAILERKHPSLGQGREGYYFGESGEYQQLEVCKIIGQTLYELGKSKTPDPTPLTKEEIGQFFNGVRGATTPGNQVR
jgi:hypothetical protein